MKTTTKALKILEIIRDRELNGVGMRWNQKINKEGASDIRTKSLHDVEIALRFLLIATHLQFNYCVYEEIADMLNKRSSSIISEPMGNCKGFSRMRFSKCIVKF